MDIHRDLVSCRLPFIPGDGSNCTVLPTCSPMVALSTRPTAANRSHARSEAIRATSASSAQATGLPATAETLQVHGQAPSVGLPPYPWPTRRNLAHSRRLPQARACPAPRASRTKIRQAPHHAAALHDRWTGHGCRGLPGRAPQNPQWYLNLGSHPDTHIQIRAERRPVHAHTADPQERSRLWPLLLEVYADFEMYQAWTEREIPVVVLHPRTDA